MGTPCRWSSVFSSQWKEMYTYFTFSSPSVVHDAYLYSIGRQPNRSYKDASSSSSHRHCDQIALNHFIFLPLHYSLIIAAEVIAIHSILSPPQPHHLIFLFALPFAMWWFNYIFSQKHAYALHLHWGSPNLSGRLSFPSSHHHLLWLVWI